MDSFQMLLTLKEKYLCISYKKISLKIKLLTFYKIFIVNKYNHLLINFIFEKTLIE